MESNVDIPCPTCKTEDSLKMLTLSSEIAYFGEHTQITLSCDNCGMRVTDYIPCEERGALAFSLSIEKIEHLNARVVRGSSGTVRIPELDLEISPGNQSTGYVSNVEGVIVRFIDIIRMMMRQMAADISAEDDAEDAETRLQLLLQLELALLALNNGEIFGEISLEILDPKGHSIIGHDDAVKRELTPEEAHELDPGPAALIMSSEHLSKE
ncbi:MAG: ZPR1 zinc finger domain-containing protein [Candidatus Thalassarchaeaceae archaeon]|jgi:zinc finger protein|nr:ZPR1 zinc finger domain-containing protein [Candidatus Thalassarchaeaceae archaeon]MDP7042505.1 ZPR1 zinc finger domain-containing protein [Candidatus Thalassarchaeaceae archaeon]